MALSTNDTGLPEPVRAALANDQYTQNGDISVTGLLTPPQLRVLRKRFDAQVEEDVVDRLWSMLGTAVHAIVERTVHGNLSYEQEVKVNYLAHLLQKLDKQEEIFPGEFDYDKGHVIAFLSRELKLLTNGSGLISSTEYIVEERLEVMLNGWKVTGKPDLVHAPEKHLYDYKVTSVWKVIKKEYTDWTAQLNYYSAMLRFKGIEIEKASIVAILRDWSEAEAKRNADYPRRAIVVIPMQLHPQQAVINSMHKRVIAHQQAELLGDFELPECTPKDQWRSDTEWAIMKKGASRASKLAKSPVEVETWLSGVNRSEYEVDERKGLARRCENYCPVSKFCPQRKREHIR